MDSNRNIPQNTCHGVIMMVYYYSELDLCEIVRWDRNHRMLLNSGLLLLIECVGIDYTIAI